jgi:uncharacterized protein (DUF427 family)
VKLVWEKPYYPTYYFPATDVRRELLASAGAWERSPGRGDAERHTVHVDGRTAEAAVGYRASSPIDELADTYTFDWSAMDHWFEEDEEVFVHARDPYTRIDILASSRRVRVEIDGVTVADTTHASLLFETGLPTRYYMPKTDVDMHLFTPTGTTTACPYKGTARYWSATVNDEVYEDILWGYDSPLPESQKITGLVSCYNEKVDIYIDEQPQDQPKTKFS